MKNDYLSFNTYIFKLKIMNRFMKNSFIDVHCHLDLCEDIDKVLEKADKSDVKIVLANGVNPKSNRLVLSIAEKYSKECKVLPAFGLYPIDALKLNENEITEEIEFIRKNKEKIYALGEVGMDFKEDNENHKKQIELFEKIIGLAEEIDKPLIVHSRKAEKECIEILEKLRAKKVIMHCFCGKLNLVDRIIKNNWFLTIPTNVKSSEHFQKVIEIVPIENLFCETDSPFLHPDKLRNNEPTNVVVPYQKIAEIKKMELGAVKQKIFDNFLKVFDKII